MGGVDIHSHTAAVKYVEATRRDPMGWRIEKDDQGRASIVQQIGG